MDLDYGPVDVVIVAMGEPRFDGSVLAELSNLTSAGTIRLLDAMVLAKSPSGARLSLNIEDLPEADRSALGHIETGTRGLFDSEDAATLFEGMVNGSAVLALAIEHAWARNLVSSIYNAGAEVAIQYRIPAPIVADAIAAAQAAD
jgi:hypothetical protein